MTPADVQALRDWAIAEREDWSERNADRYWQMCRVIAQIDLLLHGAGGPQGEEKIDVLPSDLQGGPSSMETTPPDC
jgi:hypothetical protein